MLLGMSCVVRGRQVADIADVVRQRADCLMLSGESAVGAYPDKAVGVLRAVATRIEEWCRSALLPQLYPFKFFETDILILHLRSVQKPE